MLEKLKEIKSNTFPHLKSGSVLIKVEHRNWMFETIESQYMELQKAKEEIQELKSNKRNKNFIEFATENLRLARENKCLKDESHKGCCGHEGKCKGKVH